MLDSERRLFIRQLIANIKCAVCQHRYEPDDIQIIEHQEDLWVLGVLCAECQTQGLIFAMVREVSSEESSQPDWEDDGDESDILAESNPIDADEILDVHCLLREFNGDLCDLLIASV